MAKTTAPALSFGASGSLAKSLVYSTWRGVSYARRHVVPSNPQTASQSLTRDVFSLLSTMWLLAPAILKAPWDRNAAGQKFVGRNKFMGSNVRLLRGETDMNFFQGSPGAKGGLPQDTMILTGGALQMDVDFTTPAPPAGWTLLAAQACIFKDQDPNLPFASVIAAAEDTVTFNTINFAGLEAATLYQVSGWLKWEKPDGSIAYGPSETAQDSTT